MTAPSEIKRRLLLDETARASEATRAKRALPIEAALDAVLSAAPKL